MNSLKSLLILLVAVLLPASVVSCSQNSEQSARSSADAQAEEVTPLRIVSTAPSITEILYALGLGDRVVGVSDFCDYPPEARKKPKVGGVVNPNVEAIIALQPDLVLGLPNAAHENLYRSLRQLGIKMRTLPNDTIEDLYAMIRAIGKETGTLQPAEEMVERLRAKFSEINEKVAGEPRQKVMFVVGVDPLFVAGKGTFINELIGIAGGENIAGDSLTKYPQLGIEEVVSKAPDVILYTSLNFELTGEQKDQAKKIWSAYSSIPAVKNGRICGLVADLVTLPGPRLEIGIEEMAHSIHPEVFSHKEQAARKD
jgi:iron complex transport system substrate-binding protein